MKIELSLEELQILIAKKSVETTLEAMDQQKIRLRYRKFATNTLIELSIISNDETSIVVEYKILSGIVLKIINFFGIIDSRISHLDFIAPTDIKNQYILYPFRIPGLENQSDHLLIADIRTVNDTLILVLKLK